MSDGKIPLYSFHTDEPVLRCVVYAFTKNSTLNQTDRRVRESIDGELFGSLVQSQSWSSILVSVILSFSGCC